MNRRHAIQLTGKVMGGTALAPLTILTPAAERSSKRPAPADRKFRSEAVEAKIAEVKRALGSDSELAWMFENCFPNTLDTTVRFGSLGGKPDTFVITGDIPAMWLRDSTAQVWPYLPLAHDDEALQQLIMRDAAIAVIREIGVETGGSNIQFGVHPTTGRMVVIEMNPRVSRSSALASKATGFPIAKIAAKLAVGYTLDEIPNDITRRTPACFEPTLDYVVVKIPKWQFEKFPGADENLGPQMKSVGEVMAIGRTLKEALMKGVRALDTGKRVGSERIEPKILTQRLVTPHPERLSYIRYAIRQGHTVKQLAKMTGIDPWFLYQLKEINDMQLEIEKHPMESVPTEVLRDAKRTGFSDGRLAGTWRLSGKGDQAKIRHLRKKHKVHPVYKRVDTCAAEFESYTPYLYSTYEDEDEAPPTEKKKVMEYAHQFCPPNKAAKAVGRIKRAVQTGWEIPMESALAIERENQQLLFQSEDAKEGLAAYVEKRPAEFKAK